MNRSLLTLVGLSLLLSSCESYFERTFRTDATYAANRSGYRMQIITQGVRETDQDLMLQKFVRIQICPLRPGQGRPVRLSMASDLNRSTFTINSDGLMLDEQTLTHQTTTLYQALRSAGYRNLDPAETKAMDGIISRGIYVEPFDPQQVATVTQDANGNSVITQGTTDSTLIQDWNQRAKTLAVISQTEDYDYRFNRNSPPATWIAPNDLAACEPVS